MLCRLNAQLFSTVRRSLFHRRGRRSLRLRWTHRERAVLVQHQLIQHDSLRCHRLVLYVMGLVQIPRTCVDRWTISTHRCHHQAGCESHQSSRPVPVQTPRPHPPVVVALDSLVRCLRCDRCTRTCCRTLARSCCSRSCQADLL